MKYTVLTSPPTLTNKQVGCVTPQANAPSDIFGALGRSVHNAPYKGKDWGLSYSKMRMEAK
ncbi:hypothetical protein A6770_09065 [Nostoc minutum NIES-26]|uniref:Uncharacterized protein n=1 Tax=Nostoc minutum NIES-26 TaxID=1844469 RepID=A0A367RZ09_9NOSO|nr:hypothetical protein A6770_09065 [Nostoc minutum NIES-26]